MGSNRHRLMTGYTRIAHFLRTARHQESGTELFEFALVTPLLFTLVLGIVWMSRAYNVYGTITRAAREGARFAVLPNCATCGNTYTDMYASAGACLSNPTSIFTNYVSPALAASNLDASKITDFCQMAQWMGSAGRPDCGVTIQFSYPVPIAIPFTALEASTINISTEVQMRMENQSVDVNGIRSCP